jgi:hypothetical protein
MVDKITKHSSTNHYSVNLKVFTHKRQTTKMHEILAQERQEIVAVYDTFLI